MRPGFLALTGVALAVLCAVVSAASGALLFAGRRRLARLAPAARARLLLAACLAPAAAATAASLAVASDIAWSEAPRHCAERFAEAGPSWPAALLCALWLAGIASGAARSVLAGVRALLARRRLRALAVRDARGFLRVPSGEAHAFVLGFLRPEIFVSAGLLRGADARAVETVLAHERAHARRRDPLRRLLACLALGLHLPGIAGALGRALRRAEEASADAEAARALGDRARVAEALVRFARLQLPAPLSVGFQDDALEARVREMLAAEPASAGPPAALLAALGAAAGALALAGAPALHAVLERLLALAAAS